MRDRLLGVNHVGMAVRSLDEAARRFGAMGFILTPYSPQSGAWKPGAPVQKLNSGNRCLMFGENYLEILGHENPAEPAPRIEGFLARHQGGHIICFDGDELPATEARLAAGGLDTTGILPLQREVDTAEGQRTAKFERLQFAPKDSPEGFIQVAKHLTPNYIYQPRYRVHANGCDALAETVVVADDLPKFRAKYELYCGFAPESADDARVVFRFPNGQRLTLLSPKQALKEWPGTLLAPLPAIVAVSFRCPDPALPARLARKGGLTVLSLPDGRTLVPAEDALGIAVAFEA